VDLNFLQIKSTVKNKPIVSIDLAQNASAGLNQIKRSGDPHVF
jgi:hypothetical protein